MRNGTFAERMRRDGIWDLLEEYMDIRDDLENILDNLTDLQNDMAAAMEDIHEELDSLQTQLDNTGRHLRRFKAPSAQRYEAIKEQPECLLPFDNKC